MAQAVAPQVVLSRIGPVTETRFPRLSESVQNYLVNIVRLRESVQDPVPLSHLAEALSISPISVNDMCRKLQDQGLVVYRPYKGVYLTEQGQRHAYYIVRRHRLWEVFLVQKLGFDFEEAHQAACRLEHATSDPVADQLDAFLSHPTVNPQGLPIPRPEGVLPNCTPQFLSELAAGQHAHILQSSAGKAARVSLAEQGLRPGATVQILLVSEQSLLLLVDGVHISLARSLAQTILVEPLDGSDDTNADCTLHPLPSD
jgi:DtxR family Mn-dependent transcriptional regulator